MITSVTEVGLGGRVTTFGKMLTSRPCGVPGGPGPLVTAVRLTVALGHVPVYISVLVTLPLTGDAVFLVMFSTVGKALTANVVVHWAGIGVGVPVTMKLRS